jgi:AcrR family transcriptional regulator
MAAVQGKKKQGTREKIIEMSLSLFNERGAYRITTNHIAEAMGISPGNLYYHFRNKEEIIREIFGMIIADFNLLYAHPGERAVSAAGFFEIFRKTCDLYYKYRFFYLELATLLGQDPLLKKSYRANLRNRFEQQKRYYSILIQAGIIKPSSQKELTAGLISGWIVSDFWLTWLYISGEQITPERIGGSLLQVYYLLKPYLTERAAVEIEKTL